MTLQKQPLYKKIWQTSDPGLLLLGGLTANYIAADYLLGSTITGVFIAAKLAASRFHLIPRKNKFYNLAVTAINVLGTEQGGMKASAFANAVIGGLALVQGNLISAGIGFGFAASNALIAWGIEHNLPRSLEKVSPFVGSTLAYAGIASLVGWQNPAAVATVSLAGAGCIFDYIKRLPKALPYYTFALANVPFVIESATQGNILQVGIGCVYAYSLAHLGRTVQNSQP